MARSAAARDLSPRLRLVAAWTHAHNLFGILTAVGASLDWCKDFFDEQQRQAPAEIFARDLSWWFDVAHPRQLNRLTFVLGGVSYAVYGKLDSISTTDLRQAIRGLAYPETDGVALPALSLLRDAARAPNNLDSFFGGDHRDRLSALLNAGEAEGFSSASLQALAHDAVATLTQSANRFEKWAQLHAVLGGLPAYDDIRAPLIALLIGTDFSALVDEDERCGIFAMHIACLQAINLKDESLCQHLQLHFSAIVEIVKRKSGGLTKPANADTSADQREHLKQSFFLLLDSALNLAIATNLESRSVQEFTRLAGVLLEGWSHMVPECRRTFQRLCEELPIAQAMDLWPLLVRLRAE